MTKREAAIVTAYTGFMIGDFGEFHRYAEEKTGRPVWTHEFGSKGFADQLKQLAHDDFCAIVVD